MKIGSLLLALSILSVSTVGAVAQRTTYNQRHSIRARQNRQQNRIARGVRDGQITPNGAAHAEANQARISSEEHGMRQADGGHLTTQDRHTLARQQDRTSKGIYDRNHNQYTDPGVTPHM